ncbi:hypothetical protein BGZ76_007645 [Entomortierella beljakovae]|nr:hypothetical protein BGZ76_007645 [Entomortierella beljakovae]
MESNNHTKTSNEQTKPKSRTSYPLTRKYAAISYLDANPHAPKTTVAKNFRVPRSALYLDEKQRSDYEKYRDAQADRLPALVQERSRLEQQTSLLRRVLVIYDSYLNQDETRNKLIEAAGPLIQEVMKKSMLVPQKMIKFSRDYLLRHVEFVNQFGSSPCVHEQQLYKGSMTEWVIGATIGLYKPSDIYFCDTVEEYMILDDQPTYYAAQLLCCNSDASHRESSCIQSM